MSSVVRARGGWHKRVGRCSGGGVSIVCLVGKLLFRLSEVKL